MRTQRSKDEGKESPCRNRRWPELEVGNTLNGMPDEIEGKRNEKPRIVEAVATDRKSIADALADAFFDDPVMTWILHDADDRHRPLTGLFATLLRMHYQPLGTVWTTPDFDGAALWAPPGRATVPSMTILRYIPQILGALGRHSVRALRALNHVEHFHPKEPHWYLGVLGTRKVSQGKGIGSALMGPVLGRCDDEGLPAYLESSKPSNIPFYRRFGFEVTGEIELPGGGPPVWPMWREPQSAPP